MLLPLVVKSATGKTKTAKTAKTAKTSNATNAALILDQLERCSDKKAFREHVKELNRVFQRECKKHLQKGKRPISIRLDGKTNNPTIWRFEQVGPKNFKSRIWANQIETVIQVIKECIANPGKSGVIIGSCQLGKTMTAILCQLVALVLFVVHGKLYRFVILVPANNSLERQTIEDYQNFLSLYDLSVNGISLTDYNCRLRPASLQIETHDIPIVARKLGKNGVIRADKEAELYRQEGITTIYLIDEYHWGENKNGLMDKILKFANDLQADNHGDFVIAVSATPYQVGDLEAYWKVFSRTYQGYVGYAFYNGELLDPRYDLRVPDHIGFDSDRIFLELGVADFGLVCRNCYLAEDKYMKRIKNGKKKNPNRDDVEFSKTWDGVPHDQYKLFFEDKLAEFINACLVVHNPVGKPGMAVRLFRAKQDVTNFIQKIQDRLHPSIKALAWQGDAVSQSVDSFIQENGGISDGQKVLILVSGSGRMGNRFGNYFGYFAEFSAESTLVALLQGLVGRSCGDKDVSMVFMSSKMASDLTDFVASLGKFHTWKGQIHPGVMKHFPDGHSKQLSSVELTTDLLDGIGEHDVSKFLKGFAKSVLANDQSLKSRRKKNCKHFWDFFNDELMSRLEEKLGYQPGSFLRFTSDDTQVVPPYVTANDEMYADVLGFRNAKDHTDGVTRSTPSDRLRSGTRTTNRNIMAQLHVSPAVRKGEVVRWDFVMLKLCVIKNRPLGRVKVLPNNKSIASDYLQDADYE